MEDSNFSCTLGAVGWARCLDQSARGLRGPRSKNQTSPNTCCRIFGLGVSCDFKLFLEHKPLGRALKWLEVTWRVPRHYPMIGHTTKDKPTQGFVWQQRTMTLELGAFWSQSQWRILNENIYSIYIYYIYILYIYIILYYIYIYCFRFRTVTSESHANATHSTIHKCRAPAAAQWQRPLRRPGPWQCMVSVVTNVSRWPSICCDIMLDHATANIMLLSVGASPCDGEGCEGLVTY